jgi:opacity protein-like surface antigen
MKTLLSVFLVVSISATAWSQELRLNTYAGYVFKDKVDSYFSSSSYFEGQIQDGFRWGLGLEFHVPRRGGIEIQYLRQDTEAPTIYQDGSIFNGEIQRTTFDLAINYVMINATHYLNTGGSFEPFFGGGIGLGIFNVENPENGRSDSSTKFSWQIRGGTNIWINERIALRIQASLISATQAFGGGLYFGTGGLGAGLNSYSSMYQFGLDGGIVFRLRE